MSEPVLSIAPNISAYFQDALSDAFRARRVDATEAAASYLVGLLCEFAHPDGLTGETFAKPLTFQLHEAMEAPSAERFRRLRVLGDQVLYLAGFFGCHMETKGVDRGYVLGVGSTAYHHAAAMLRPRGGKRSDPPAGDVLRELAGGFPQFADVLRDLADGTLACGARNERTLVKLYERWLATGSSKVAEELGQRGILPKRGAGGLH